MNKIVKRCAGIDVSQDEIDSTFGTSQLDQTIDLLESKKFKNARKSFPVFLKWVLKRAKQEGPLVFVMEATGVYHERLACYLVDHGQQVVVVLPNRASSYAKSLEVKTVTDKEASRSLCRMGLEKKMALWSKPDPIFNNLKQLTREREQLQKAKTIFKNQLHAEQKSAWPNKKSLSRVTRRIKILQDQVREIEKDIKEFIESHPDLKRKMAFPSSIKGVGIITTASVIGETNGFRQMENKRQLVSYSGYDVIRKDSGTSVHSKPRISKRGNRHIRKAMHFPALCSIKHDPQSKSQFARMVSNHGIKMKAAVAIQRKLLVLMYTLWKKEEFYDPEYDSKKADKKIGQLALP